MSLTTHPTHVHCSISTPAEQFTATPDIHCTSCSLYHKYGKTYEAARNTTHSSLCNDTHSTHCRKAASCVQPSITPMPLPGLSTHSTKVICIIVHTVYTETYKAQWSIYVSHSGHYMYGHSGHYMNRTVVTVCTAQWSLYVRAQWSLYERHSGHYMNRTVVTICTAQWSPYVPRSGHRMYRNFNIQQYHVQPT